MLRRPLLTLTPLALSLLAAWGLRTGRRSAWLLGIAVSAATAAEVMAWLTG